MRLYLPALIAILTIIFITDGWLFFRKIRKKHIGVRILSFVPTCIFTAFMLYAKFGVAQLENYKYSALIIWMFWAFAIIYVPKFIYIIFDAIEVLCQHIFHLKSKFISRIGIILSLTILFACAYGAFIDRNRVHVKQVEIVIDKLPQAFDGLTIAQFSDTHLGNWNDNTKVINKTVELINAQQPDLIMFTGDMVNNFSEETKPYTDIFRKLNAKYGKYAILGNHDYGDYTQWPSAEARDANLRQIKEAIRNFGFDLLLNENRELQIDSQRIYIVGVENWGASKHFPKYGNLQQALINTDSTTLKILLSHDSSHWRAEVIGKKDIVLTLSGHTHAAQVGLVTRNIHISPASAIYGEWDGLYKNNNQYLYVNRGIGYVGIPMRIGVAPEVTLITLRSN